MSDAPLKDEKHENKIPIARINIDNCSIFLSIGSCSTDKYSDPSRTDGDTGRCHNSYQ